MRPGRRQRLLPGALLPVVLALGVALTGCTSEEPGDPKPSAPTSTATTPATADEVPVPKDRACFDLSYADALAPTNSSTPVDCAEKHTSMTYAVGELDSAVQGHLLSVDSKRVQAQVARVCPERLSRFLGGTPEDLRLTMLRAVWFTPTVEESDAGANWFRCDVIAVAADGKLDPLTGRLAGVLAKPEARGKYAMCATAEPGTPDFSRVVCSREHAWRAIRTVDVPGADYPGEEAAREAGQGPCEDAARDRADDALNFTWGYEWPTAAQWRAGQTYGLCWIPD
ncbi:septum formation family protein [Nocardioides sp.]|uniref:septum formation family protein n=1 Tax=Nocardioides sp. TaxID=35761 RepID=UPI003566A8A4